jgi:hypothetical protein
MYIESGKENLHYLRNYKNVAKKVKRIFEKRLNKVDVYVFGSLIEGKPTALSDIDMLIIADNISRQEIYELKTEAIKAIAAPMQLHVISTEEFQKWYKRFINKLEKIT